MFTTGTEIDTPYFLQTIINEETFIAPRNQRRNYEMETDLILHHEKNMSAPWPTPMRTDVIQVFYGICF